MTDSKIHPTAIVEDGARLGAGCIIHAHAIVTRHCRLDEAVVVHPFAVLGGPPQDLSFKEETPSEVQVGPRTTIREHATINRATKAGGATRLGADCFLMAASHVAHDCQVGNNVILANAALLGGHVHVGDRAFIGGGAVVHQFGRVGESVMVGGGSRIAADVPPFCLVAERHLISGLNVVGLRRRGFPQEVLKELKAAFREVSAVGNRREIAAAALASGRYRSVQARQLLEFFLSGKRPLARFRRASAVRDAVD